MASVIDVSSVVSEYGAYYLGNQGNMDTLMTQVRVVPRSMAQLRPYFAEGDTVRLTNESLDEVVQSFQSTFTSKTTATYTPKVLELFNLKIDWAGKPDTFKQSYLEYLNAPVTEQDRTKAPYIAHVMQQLIAQSHHDRETLSYKYGQYKAPVSGTPGKAINAMDGLVKVMTDAVNAGGRQFLLTNDPAVLSQSFDAFEEMAEDLPTIFEGKRVVFLADPVLVRKMLKDKRNTLGTNVDYTVSPIIDFSDIYGDGVGWEVKPMQCLAGTGIVGVTLADNIVHVTRQNAIPMPKVEGYRREVSIFTDWWEGIGVIRPELMYLYRPDWSYSGSNSTTLV